MSRAVGIDLGTTYTAVAVVDEYGKASIVKNTDGQATTPSVVYVDHPHYIVGEVALQSTLTDPERVCQFVKRSMGLLDHRVIIDGRSFSPEFISSVILRKVVQEASDALGEPIDSVVITVPAYFSKAQRQATFDAGVLAGLNVLRIINEPTAAALSYGIATTANPASQNGAPVGQREIIYRGQRMLVPAAGNPQAAREISYRGRKVTVGNAPNGAKSGDKPRKVLVYDLGGGTFDVTILAITKNSLDVLAVGGESHLGGKDFDDAIMNFIEAQFEQKYGVPLQTDASLEAELRLKAENAKRQLSVRPNAAITFKAKALLPGNGASESIVPVRIELTRAEFESITAEMMNRTLLCVETILGQSQIGWAELDEILCVGGSSKMPMVREILERVSGKTPLLHDPDECVAKGAALQAAMILREGETQRDDFARSATQMSVNHVLPHTLGVATTWNHQTTVEPVIPALTPLPCSSAREEFTTTIDDQTQVSVLIYEGESRDPGAYPDGPIGVFHLDTTPPRPKGVPKIRVEFRCDENGRIIALARDQDTGKESRAFIHLGNARTDEEMRAEATWLSEAVIS